jgi:hypothetical protein
MFRKAMAAGFAVLLVAAAASAQTAAPFRWQMGQTLTYRAEEATQATEVVGDAKIETKTRLNLTKRWQVTAVDPAGVATLQLSLAALRHEMTTAGGETLLYDSANPDKSTPQLREQMARYVGTVLAVLRVDGYGRVVEVKEAKHGSAHKYEVELPFVGMLPANPRPGQTWERAYQITLDPPQGTGEKHNAVQKYTCKTVADGAATIAVTTELKAPPEAAADRAALVQFLPEGEIVFDLKAGRLRSASLRIDKELKGHQGEGSSYHYVRTYSEQYAGDR